MDALKKLLNLGVPAVAETYLFVWMSTWGTAPPNAYIQATAGLLMVAFIIWFSYGVATSTD
jgi:hypothetical protein